MKEGNDIKTKAGNEGKRREEMKGEVKGGNEGKRRWENDEKRRQEIKETEGRQRRGM